MSISVVDNYLSTGESTAVSLWSNGISEQGEYYLGINKESGASLNIDNAHVIYLGNVSSVYWLDYPEVADALGIQNPFVVMDIVDIPLQGEDPIPATGLLVDNIIFRMDSSTYANLYLFNWDGELLDTQTIINPEPATLMLLGLGGIFLRNLRINKKISVTESPLDGLII